MSRKKSPISSSNNQPCLTLQEAYNHLRKLRRPVRKSYVARLIGAHSGEAAMLRFDNERLLMWESDAGWVMPLEKLE